MRLMKVEEYHWSDDTPRKIKFVLLWLALIAVPIAFVLITITGG